MALQDLVLFHFLKVERCHTKVYDVPVECLLMLDQKVVCPYTTCPSVCIHLPNKRQEFFL